MSDSSIPSDEPTLEESNNARLAVLNSIGFAVNGVNEARLTMMLEALLTEEEREGVRVKHQEWLAGQLTSLEDQVLEKSGAKSMDDLLRQVNIQKTLTIPGRN